jgi:hypothetical protein
MNLRPRFLAALTTVLLLAPFTPDAHAADAAQSVPIRLDGQAITFPDAQPIVSNSRLLVPVRFVSEALGATVDWDHAARTVTIRQADRFILLHLADGCGLDDCNGPSLAEQKADAVLAVLTEFGYATDPEYAVRLQALLDQPGLLPNGQSLRSLDRIQF